VSAAVWEWVGLSVLGALGMFFTWLSGKQGRDHAERLVGSSGATADGY
jgi:hypothetical protein